MARYPQTLVRLNLAVLLAMSVAGCTLQHTVALEPIERQPVAAPIPIPARILIPADTANYIYQVRAVMAGYGNEWEINVGKAIAQYADAILVPAFAPGSALVIQIAVEKFDVHDFEAHCDARFTVQGAGRTVFQKSYHGKGLGYAARVVWGGPFAMKSSMQKTTDEALRSLFNQFLQDATARYREWSVS